MKRIYVVMVESKKYKTTRISQNAYFDYNEAKDFVLSRSDNPKMTNRFLLESDENKYIITDVLAQ